MTTLTLARPVAAPASRRLGHVPALDGLRGLAVLLVMLYHFGVPFLPFGFLGVDVFFVLSGFLITSLLAQEWDRSGAVSLRRFYARRALRLVPALVLLALVLSPVVPLYQIAASLLYVANWTIALGDWPMQRGFLTHVWSLSVEGQFYALWPPVLVYLLRRRTRRGVVLGATVGLATLSVALHWLLWATGAGWLRTYYGADTRMSELLVGSAVGLVVTWRLWAGWPCVGLRYAWLPALAIVLLAGSTDIQAFTPLQYAAFVVLVGAVVLEVVQRPRGLTARVLCFLPLVGVGRISYGLYLWHVPVLLVLSHLQIDGAVGLALRLTLSLAIALLSYRYVESPFLHIKVRYQAHS